MFTNSFNEKPRGKVQRALQWGYQSFRLTSYLLFKTPLSTKHQITANNNYNWVTWGLCHWKQTLNERGYISFSQWELHVQLWLSPVQRSSLLIFMFWNSLLKQIIIWVYCQNIVGPPCKWLDNELSQRADWCPLPPSLSWLEQFVSTAF